jgi:hypothetical protein
MKLSHSGNSEDVYLLLRIYKKEHINLHKNKYIYIFNIYRNKIEEMIDDKEFKLYVFGAFGGQQDAIA